MGFFNHDWKEYEIKEEVKCPECRDILHHYRYMIKKNIGRYFCINKKCKYLGFVREVLLNTEELNEVD